MIPFGVVVADPPWQFSDRLGSRGADKQYQVLGLDDIWDLQVANLAAEDAVCALWCPKSMFEDGLVTLQAWGFRYVTFYTWTKRTKAGDPAFGMGRLFRATGEAALVGVRGNVYGELQSRSERDYCESRTMEHSEKPEALQDSLDAMFPHWRKLEIFARRVRDGWVCVGNECPSTKGEDVRQSIRRLANEMNDDTREIL